MDADYIYCAQLILSTFWYCDVREAFILKKNIFLLTFVNKDFTPP